MSGAIVILEICPLLQFACTVEIEQEAKCHEDQNGSFNELATFRFSEFLLYVRIVAKFVYHIPEDSESCQVTNNRGCNADRDEKEPEKEISPTIALVAFRCHVK